MKEFDGPRDQVSTLRHLFGDNRAEWPPESFRDLFVPPTYIKKLEFMRPSFLIGGRGTGKTTALQSLRFDETLERLQSQGLSFSDQEYLGILVRMNKNRVHAFKGGGIEEATWGKAFAHFFNLIVCLELTKLALWLESVNEEVIDEPQIHRIGNDLGLGDVSSFSELQQSIQNGISRLQLFVNNPSKQSDVIFSMPESPLRVFAEVLGFSGALGERIIFCCVDEYENLLDYQQGIVNTYIKHATSPLSYKIGVRKYGLRNRNTIDNSDLLSTPDDFSEIEIIDEGFEYFATEVANRRLAFLQSKGISVPATLDEFLENMTIAEEAIHLGAGKICDGIVREIKASDNELANFLITKPPAEVYFLRYWQEKTGSPIKDLARDWKENEDIWKTRIGNHGYASLFWLSKGKKGIRTRKYYSGPNTVLSLSGGNIRYFLELIDAAISHEVGLNSVDLPDMLTLSAKSQTQALKDVGARRLNQLEGLADQGVQLKRLVLAIGKVFFELARSPASRSPEVNSFVLAGKSTDIDKMADLLQDGASHLAFEISPRTKSTSNLELRDNEYRLHRIFSGFFEISYRKKRRTTFDAADLIEAVEGKPSKAISSMLNQLELSEPQELTEQMAFFAPFYDGSGE